MLQNGPDTSRYERFMASTTFAMGQYIAVNGYINKRSLALVKLMLPQFLATRKSA